MKPFSVKIKELIESKEGLNTVKLADILNTSQSTISQWQLGLKGASKENMRKLADFFNVPLEYLANDKFDTPESAVDNKSFRFFNKNQSDTVYVPFFKDGRVSAGFGTENYDNGEHEFLPFKPQDLRLMFNASPNAVLGIIPCLGNSMEPTIMEGDLVVFQKDDMQIEGAIYVCRYDNELFVKRLKKRPYLSLISDNKEYEPISVNELEEVYILGRVVGSYSINSKKI